MKRSSDILNGAEWANVRALYKSSGFTDDEIEESDYSGSQCI